MRSERRRRRRPRYERRIFPLGLLTGLPAVALALVLLWRGDFAARTQWTLTILLVGVWLAFVGVVRERVVRPLQTISNMLAALREGDQQRSEEHTSELQSQSNLVCRLLLEKKKKT